MKENVLKTFIRDTYQTSSIPYIITGQAFMFIIIHIFDLLYDVQAIRFNLFESTYSHLSLPANWNEFLSQPWSFLTHPFIYKGIFSILFDCIWLYWIGNIFLNFLNNRQFNTIFFGGIILGAITFLLIGQIPFLSNSTVYWNTTSTGLAALISSVAVLVPSYEVRLFLFGNVRLKTIAMVYLGLEFAFLMISNRPAAITYLFIIAFGIFFMTQLKKGNDWSNIFKKKRHLKIVENKTTYTQKSYKKNEDLSNQEIIDQILDKISLNGYESLTSQEKDILFKASKRGE